jgi:hypothetical protein
VAIDLHDYVLLKLQPDGKKTAHPVFFVGLVVSREKDGWKVKCMRRYRSLKTAFVFPVKDDIEIYPDSQIVKVLKMPKVERNVHHFAVHDLAEFSMLR